MRVTQSAHTRCWGVVLAFGLQLPAVLPPAPPAGQAVPPPVTRTAPRAPWAAVWSEPARAPAGLLLALSRDFVFTAGPETALEARTAATGAVAWTHPLAAWAALATTDTIVLGVSGDHAYALDAATGQTRWVTQTTGPNTRLAVSAGQLLLLSDVDVLLRDIASGTALWHSGLTSPPASAAPAFSPDLVVFAQQDGTLVALERPSGQQRWRARLHASPLAMSVHSPVVYVGLDDGGFCGFNDRDGSPRWRCFPLRVPVVGPPAVSEGIAWIALRDTTLRSFDGLNGAMRPQVPLGHRPAAGPWLTGDFMVVALTTGEFVVVDRRTPQIVSRLPVPDTTASHLLESGAISTDGRTLASLTIAPGGERRLSLYRAPSSSGLPLTNALPDGRAVSLVLPPRGVGVTAPGGRSPAPRPFPTPR
jgi:hypothetical protein